MYEQAFCISLKKVRIQRYPYIKSCMDIAKAILIDAFDGSTISKTNRKGAIGCFISHLSVYNYCLKNGIDSALILEDDVLLTEENIAIIKPLSKQADYTNMTINGWKSKRLLSACTACYCIKKNVMELAIGEINNKKSIHIDNYLSQLLEKHNVNYSNYPVLTESSRGGSVKTTVSWDTDNTPIEANENQLIKRCLRHELILNTIEL